MEIESLHWIGAHELSGKHFYSNETCHLFDTMYGQLDPFDLEWIRQNHPVALTEGSNKDMSLDRLYELVSCWNKSPSNSHDFTTVCNRSMFLMVTRACAVDTMEG